MRKITLDAITEFADAHQNEDTGDAALTFFKSYGRPAEIEELQDIMQEVYFESLYEELTFFAVHFDYITDLTLKLDYLDRLIESDLIEYREDFGNYLDSAAEQAINHGGKDLIERIIPHLEYLNSFRMAANCSAKIGLNEDAIKYLGRQIEYDIVENGDELTNPNTMFAYLSMARDLQLLGVPIEGVSVSYIDQDTGIKISITFPDKL